MSKVSLSDFFLWELIRRAISGHFSSKFGQKSWHSWAKSNFPKPIVYQKVIEDGTFWMEWTYPTFRYMKNGEQSIYSSQNHVKFFTFYLQIFSWIHPLNRLLYYVLHTMQCTIFIVMLYENYIGITRTSVYFTL